MKKKQKIDHSQFDKDWALFDFSIQLCIVESAIKIMRQCFDKYVEKCTKGIKK